MANRDRTEVTVTNRSNQTLGLQACPPGGDFFLEQHQIRLRPAGKKGSSTTLPKSYLNWGQIENCRAMGKLSVVEVR